MSIWRVSANLDHARLHYYLINWLPWRGSWILLKLLFSLRAFRNSKASLHVFTEDFSEHFCQVIYAFFCGTEQNSEQYYSMKVYFGLQRWPRKLFLDSAWRSGAFKWGHLSSPAMKVSEEPDRGSCDQIWKKTLLTFQINWCNCAFVICIGDSQVIH